MKNITLKGRNTAALIVLFIAVLMAAPVALAQGNMQPIAVTAQNQNNANVMTQAQANSALSADAPNGIGLLWTRIRYMFSSNEQEKTNLRLRIAEANLERANNNAQTGNNVSVSAAVNAYETALTLVQNNMNQIHIGNATSKDFRQSVELQNRIQLNIMQLETLRERIMLNTGLNASEKQSLLAKINSSEQKLNVMEQTNSQIKASVQTQAKEQDRLNETEASRIEADVELGFFNHAGGLKEAASANINTTERILAKIRANSATGNSTLTANANTQLNAAQNAYSNGDYKLALKEALQAKHSTQFALNAQVSGGENSGSDNGNEGLQAGLNSNESPGKNTGSEDNVMIPAGNGSNGNRGENEGNYADAQGSASANGSGGGIVNGAVHVNADAGLNK